MDNIIIPDMNFEFSQLSLDNPMPLQGGAFFTKINYKNDIPLYIQLPKCVSKNGIVKNTSTKKPYIDLQFNFFEKDLLTWFENLEEKCRELINIKKDIWFQNELSYEDIENMFISPTKPYKSGKFLIVRTHIPVTKTIKQQNCLIYDENERILDSDSINDLTQFIPLVHIEGIKFSSKSFSLEINIRQTMVLSIEENIKKNCLIKHQNINTTNEIVKQEVTEEIKNNKEEDYILKSENTLEKINEQKINEENIEGDTLEISNTNIKDISDIKNDSKDCNENNTDLTGNELMEVNLEVKELDDTISLKNPKEVYYDIYKSAYQKARQIKQSAIEAYLEARNIKLKYNLEDIELSDDEDNNFAIFEK